jgi:hypothetical protein
LKWIIQLGNGILPDRMCYAELLTSFDRMLDLKIETREEHKVRLLKDQEYRWKKQSNMIDEEKKLWAKKTREWWLNEMEEAWALQLKKDGLCRKLHCSWWWIDEEFNDKSNE